MKSKIRNFSTKIIKKEPVLVIASILAVITAFFNPPGKEYLDYIDFRVLGILLSLMLVVAGLQANGVFVRMAEVLISGCNSVRKLAFVLVFLCFFSGMLITNDVALITFVPFAILTLKMGDKEKYIIPVIVLQTVAANLGSMLTPMGNPQNLFLYGISGISMVEFMKLTLPYIIISACMLAVFIFFIKNEPLKADGNEKQSSLSVRQIAVYIILFILCILTVLRVIEWYIVMAIVGLVIVIMDKSILKKADYGLLLTFIAFFVFVGNMSEFSGIREMLSSVVKGRELLVSVVSSQFISNVPAAVLLSGFTDNYRELIVGINIGGLGTLIASMASLISYKLFANAYPHKKGAYMMRFTVTSIVFLGVLFGTAYILGC